MDFLNNKLLTQEQGCHSSKKGNNHITQLQVVFEYLKEHIATASMVADATGVPQKCITRYKRNLEKAGLLWELNNDICQKTGFMAWYLTTDFHKFTLALILNNNIHLPIFDSTKQKSTYTFYSISASFFRRPTWA